jgi:hypothetical protein
MVPPVIWDREIEEEQSGKGNYYRTTVNEPVSIVFPKLNLKKYVPEAREEAPVYARVVSPLTVFPKFTLSTCSPDRVNIDRTASPAFE